MGLTHLGVFSRPSHKTKKWQLCQKLACHNLGESCFTAGVNRPTSRCCSSGPAKEHYKFMVPMVEHIVPNGALRLTKVSELVKGRASCHKIFLQIYKWQSYPKWDLLCVLLAIYRESGPIIQFDFCNTVGLVFVWLCNVFLTHLSRLEFPTLINWNGSFLF